MNCVLDEHQINPAVLIIFAPIVTSNYELCVG